MSTPNIPTNQAKNEEVEITINRKSPCKVELQVKAFPPCIKNAEKQAIKAVNKEVTIPGFRKGKAPDELILKKYGDKVKNQLHKTLADTVFISVQKLIHIPPLARSSSIVYNLKSFKPEEEADLTFSYETEPDVPTVDPQTCKIKKITSKEIEESRVDEMIHQMQFFHAQWKEVDREVRERDYVLIDVESLDIDPPALVFSNTRFAVTDQQMVPWMKKLVLGTKTGDTIEGISYPHPNLSEEEKKNFPEKKVRIKINKVEEAQLPPLDLEFAKKMGCNSTEELRQSVKTILTSQQEAQVKKEMEEQVNDFLIKTYKFDLPQSFVAAEEKHRKDHLLKEPGFKEKWDKMSPEKQREIENTLLIEAQHAITLFYLSKKIIKDAKLEISDKEILKKATMFGIQPTDPKSIPSEILGNILSKIILEKAQNYILDNATYY